MVDTSGKKAAEDSAGARASKAIDCLTWPEGAEIVDRDQLDNAVQNLLAAADVYEAKREDVFGTHLTHHSAEGKAFRDAVLAYRKVMQ